MCQSVLTDRSGRLLGEVASLSADLRHGYFIREHSHPEDQLLFAAKGVMTVRTVGDIWVVPPMRAVWIPAKIVHSVAVSGELSMRTLYFLRGLCPTLPAKCAVINVSPLLRELVFHACAFGRLRSQVAGEARLTDLIFDQLVASEQIPLQLSQPSDSRALRIAAALTDDPADPRSLEKLCRDCGASKRTILRLFLDQTNMTFERWRQQHRLLHALRLLASGEKVTAAALESGYSSTSAFISMFRKQLGTTPARYLKLTLPYNKEI